MVSVNEIRTFATYLQDAQKIVFFGGAGVSTESGLPDYRSKNGVYTAMENDGKDPKKVMNIKYMLSNPKDFFERRQSNSHAKPNVTHNSLVELEQKGKDVTIITQNVDGLHQKAGSSTVYELHGSDRIWYCMDCGHEISPEEVEYEDGIPTCQICQGLMRPNITYFGEMPDRETNEKSREAISQADLLIIAGTSLTVSPAKSLIQFFKGEHVVVINQEPVDTWKLAVDLTFTESVGKIMSQTMSLYEKGNEHGTERGNC